MCQIRRVNRQWIDWLWTQVRGGTGPFLQGPGATFRGFIDFINQADFIVVGDGFTLTFDPTDDPAYMRAHGFIYSLRPIRSKRLIKQAFEHTMKQLELRRIDITFPYQTRQLHAILKEAGFTQEGVLRKYFDWNGHIYDAAIYSLTRED